MKLMIEEGSAVEVGIREFGSDVGDVTVRLPGWCCEMASSCSCNQSCEDP